MSYWDIESLKRCKYGRGRRKQVLRLRKFAIIVNEGRLGANSRWWREVWKQKQEQGGLRFFTRKRSDQAAVHGGLLMKRSRRRKWNGMSRKGKKLKKIRKKEVEKKIDSQVKTHLDCNK